MYLLYTKKISRKKVINLYNWYIQAILRNSYLTSITIDSGPEKLHYVIDSVTKLGVIHIGTYPKI